MRAPIKHPSIPRVMCPMCGQRMRFATYVPTERDDSYRMTFDCLCGFNYQLSETAAAEVLAEPPRQAHFHYIR